MSYYINKAKDIPKQEVFPGIVGHLIHTDRVTIGDFYIEAGTKLPAHSHPHEQTSTILEGQFEFNVGGQVKRCGPGDVAVIPSNVEHAATAITDCRILDVFGPYREDYKAVTDRLKENWTPKSKPYTPIDCGFYDHFEAAIVQRREVALVYTNQAGDNISLATKLRDLKTDDKIEYVQLADQTWVRLDRVLSLGGVAAVDFGENCKM